MEARDLRIGVLLPYWTGSLAGETPDTARVLAFARHAEAAGLDSLWLTDHLYWEAYEDFKAVGIELPSEYAGVKGGQWECWTTAAALAVATRRITIGTLVSNTSFRNPALLARTADTVTDLSDGRLVLGLGAGDFTSEHRAYGFDFERHVGRFENALEIAVPLLRGERFSHRGEFHVVDDAMLLPASVHGPPPVLIGTLRGLPRMSRLVAQYADMWNCMIAFGDCAIDTYRAAWQPVHAACEKHGRDPATLEQGATVAVNFTDGPYAIVPTSTPFSGSTREIADRFAEYAAAGVAHVSVIPHPWNEAGVEQLAAVIACLRG